MYILGVSVGTSWFLSSGYGLNESTTRERGDHKFIGSCAEPGPLLCLVRIQTETPSSTSCRGAVRVTLDEIKHTYLPWWESTFYSAQLGLSTARKARTNAERWWISSVYHPVLFMILDEIFLMPHFRFSFCARPWFVRTKKLALKPETHLRGREQKKKTWLLFWLQYARYSHQGVDYIGLRPFFIRAPASVALRAPQ